MRSSEALRTWRIEMFVADLDTDVRAGLRSAQARQFMVNPTGAATSQAIS